MLANKLLIQSLEELYQSDSQLINKEQTLENNLSRLITTIIYDYYYGILIHSISSHKSIFRNNLYQQEETENKKECSQPRCNRLLPHPPVYKRLDYYWEYKFNIDFKTEYKTKFLTAYKLNKLLISTCSVWWRPFIKPLGDGSKLTKVSYHNSQRVSPPFVSLLYTINNGLSTNILKYNSCKCQICILDTLYCHCSKCVLHTFKFINFPTFNCVHLDIWKSRLLHYLNNSSICCCTLHTCFYKIDVCYCKKCTFKIKGCTCMRCLSYDIAKEDIKCNHQNDLYNELCKHDIVYNWIKETYQEILHKYYNFTRI